ncbi:DUF3892 domain-containing protein [Neobacillus sp. FSL H8-0543]|uniref:DUF3892 domain-containing protein n=1 Tax=Neobacillus sp. FSL H8-0543 TaxID=2954672 RepID=UPI003158CD86
METLVALHRNHYGEIISFVTSTGRIISYQKALVEMESGLIQGVQATEDSEGNMLLSPESEQTFDHYPDLF